MASRNFMFLPEKKTTPRRQSATPIHLSSNRTVGFTLIVTIILLSLMVLALVSLASFTRVETQVATNAQQAETARQNALAALNIALGQIQAAAGPDQRITARAEILDSKADDAKIDNVNQPYWTGVWKTGSAPLDLTDQPGITVQRTTSLGSTSPTITQKIDNATAWLVSSPSGSSVNPTTAKLTVSDDLSETTLSASASISGVTGGAAKPTAVVLAKKYGRQDPSALPSASNPGFIVAAPLVDLTATPPGFSSSTPIGRYAYWIGDEGVKAKINMTDHTLGLAADNAATATTAQTHFLAPQGAPAQKIAGMVKDVSKDFRSENKGDLGKVFALNSVSNLSTTPTGLNLKPYQSDVTVYSQGVLADVKHGGLKKDLTAAFETPSEYTKLTGDSSGGVSDYGYQKNMLYRNYPSQTIPYFGPPAYAPTTDSVGQTDGLSWTALYAYYNTYKSTMVAPAPAGVTPPLTAGVKAPVVTGSLSSSAGYTLSPRLIGVNAGIGTKNPTKNAIQGGIYPEVLAFSMDVALKAMYNIKGDGKWRLYLLRYPQLILYNPYSCRLSFNGFQLNKVINGGFRDTNNYPYCITITVNGLPAATNIPLGPRAGGQVYLVTKSGECNTLEPGETRIFGIAVSDVSTGTYSNWGLADQVESHLVAGNVANWANYTELPLTAVSDNVVNPKAGNYSGSSFYAGTANAGDLVNASITLPNSSYVYSVVNTMSMKLTTGTTVPAKAAPRFPIATTDLIWPQHGAGDNYGQPSYGVRNSGTANLPAWTPLPISGLTTPRILAGIRLRRNGLVPKGDANYANSTTAVPHFHGNAPGFSIFSNSATLSWFELYTNNNFGKNYSANSIFSDVHLLPNINGNGYFEAAWGDQSVGLDSSTAPRRVLSDVPCQPLVSLGQFMHMTTMNTVWDSWQCLTRRDSGSMAVGGSLCSPFIATDKNLYPYFGNTEYIFDDSFLANDNLFDRFYFSTVPPAAPSAPVPQQWTDWAGDTSKPLPNSRMKPYARNGVAPTLANMRDFDQAAANLMLNGAFNVNSTSVDAWKILLSSLSGNDLRVFNPTTKKSETIPSSALKNPIPRFWGSSTITGGAWDGARALTDGEVTTLAKSIVEQVKTRGPFLSMADFLNRRLGPSSALTRAGCLQAAIDNTTLNDGVKASGTVVNATGGGLSSSDIPGLTVVSSNLLDGADKPLNTTVGMPGYLMQQDIVQAFSPVMTVRSDTFVIRTYGESVNPATGLSQSKAWAEAVVQRLPEFVDLTDSNLSSGDATAIVNLNLTNKNFGRRFKVVSFRWLTPDDL